MTRDDIIKQMGWPSNANAAISDLVDRVEAVIRKAEEAEREACAKEADLVAKEFHNGMATYIAAAIRARGENK
jgi:hypothetical protein